MLSANPRRPLDVDIMMLDKNGVTYPSGLLAPLLGCAPLCRHGARYTVNQISTRNTYYLRSYPIMIMPSTLSRSTIVWGKSVMFGQKGHGTWTLLSSTRGIKDLGRLGYQMNHHGLGLFNGGLQRPSSDNSPHRISTLHLQCFAVQQ